MLDLSDAAGPLRRRHLRRDRCGSGRGAQAAQQIPCQMFALKVLRVQLLVQKILSGESVNLHTEIMRWHG
jgi:hypothetical protein